MATERKHLLAKHPSLNTVSKRKTVDYKLLTSFAKRYLETYYKAVDSDEAAIANFLVREYKKIKGKPKMLELGCGPTVHHVLPAVPYVSSIDMADYLPDNLRQIKLWQKNEKTAHNWEHFTKHILELEGKKPTIGLIKERENQLRKLINKFMHCDVLKDPPLGRMTKYSVVGFYYCAEEVASNKIDWTKIMKRACDIVEPNGRLYIAALRSTRYYSIVKPDGSFEKLPTAFITENDIKKTLFKFGFTDLIIETALTPDQKDYGVSGVILVSAKKNTNA